MKITKESLRVLVRQMIKEEKGLSKGSSRKNALRNMIKEQLTEMNQGTSKKGKVITEGAPKMVKNGEKFTVESPENFKMILIQGLPNTTWKREVDTGKSQDYNYIKGIIDVSITNQATKQSKGIEGLGIEITDNTATNGVVLIKAPMSTIKRVTGRFGEISQTVSLKIPKNVRVKLVESKKSKGSLLKEETIKDKARIPAQGITNVILRGFADSNWGKLKPKTSVQAQESKQNPVIQVALNGTAEIEKQGSTLVIQAAGEGVTIKLLTPAYQSVSVKADETRKTGDVKTIGTRGGYGRGEFDY